MIPRMKTGKETYQQLNGGTYTPIRAHAQEEITGDTRYRRIETDEAVLPGFYIWWSIHVDNADIPLYDIPQYIHRLSISFIDPPQSRYGKKRISTSSLHLLQSYQNGFVNNGHYPRLQFRNGGTLRYKREICYVVIVCAKDNFTGTDNDYPVIEHATNPVIPANIEYDGNGRITDVEQWSVTIRNGKLTTGTHRIERYPFKKFSWDHYAFAFHFPQATNTMEIPSDIDTNSPRHVRVNDVTHTNWLCTKKEYSDRTRHWECPDPDIIIEPDIEDA